MRRLSRQTNSPLNLTLRGRRDVRESKPVLVPAWAPRCAAARPGNIMRQRFLRSFDDQAASKLGARRGPFVEAPYRSLGSLRGRDLAALAPA